MLILGFLTTLSVSAAVAQGYSLDASSVALALRLTDVDTNISPISLLLQDKATKVTVEGLSWKSSNQTDVDSAKFLNYTTFVDDEEVTSGIIPLMDDPLELPLFIDAGNVVVASTGTKLLRVVLVDHNLQAAEIQMEMRAYPAWVAGIPFVISLTMFVVFNADLIQALFVAIFVGSCIAHGSLLQGFRAIFDTYMLHAATSTEHVALIFFIMGIFVFMEMVNKSGGTNELLRALSPYTSRARIAQVVLFFLGLLTYFDPYASILMTGKVFGSVLKGFPISSEKLSFLTDTAALPVSSIIPGSTWCVLATSALQNGINLAQEQQDHDDIDGKSLLVSSIKYQFYPVLILAMTALQMFLSREAGAMLKSENEKRSKYGDDEQELETALSAIRRSAQKEEKSWNWWLPVLTLNIILWAAFLQVGTDNIEGVQYATETDFVSSFITSTAATVVLVQMLFLYQPQQKLDWRRLMFWRKDETRLAFLTDTFPSGSSSIPYAVTSKSEGLEEQHIDADFGDIIAGPKRTRRTHTVQVEAQDRRKSCKKHLEKSCVLSPNETLECLSQGIAGSLPMILSLIFSWSAGEVCTGLGFDRIAIGWILNENIATEAVPTVAYFSAFLLSLVVGSSWTALSVMLPAISMSYRESDSLTLIVGSILSGAVAGDHIGPFSDTTILSGFTTNCGVRRHFISQAPCAISVFLLSVLVGTLPISFSAYPEFIGFFVGVIVICIGTMFVCRRVQNPAFVPGRASEAITQELHSTRNGPNEQNHAKYLPGGMIMPVNTDDLIDRDEDHVTDQAQSSIGSEPIKTKKPSPMIRTHTLQSFKSKLQELNSGSGDPILGLVADGLLPSDITRDLKNPPPQQQSNQSSLGKIPRDPSAMSKKATFESKKRLIEATIKSSEKEGNIFSESLRMFLRTAETKLDQIMSDGSIDIQASESNDTDDDSLDNLMMDIAAKGWKPAANNVAAKQENGDTETVEGYTTAGGYTTGGDYTTDGGQSILEESDDSASASTTTSSGGGQSTAFTTDAENQSTSTSTGPSVYTSEGTQGAEEQMRATLMNPLVFHKSHQVFAWMNGTDESNDETSTAYGSRDPSKASF